MKNKENIGIIGYGVVGKALSQIFLSKINAHIYDKYLPEYQDLKKVVKSCNKLFISVPTPMNRDGSMDLSCIRDAVSSINKEVQALKKKEVLLILRSTIIPGTTDSLQKEFPNLKFVFNPEFLSERNYLEDMKNSNRFVLGGSKEDCEKVAEFYKTFFPNAKYVITNPKTAEMIKYSANVTLASQVMIANELYQICKSSGIDWGFIRDSIILDPLIGRNNNVPGPDGDLGFGGKCLPKDLNALICLAKSNNYNPELLEQVWKSNLKLRKNQNWLEIKGATSENKFGSI